ncbi:MAG: hypothetical protein A2Z24_03050 [Candidatus Woykebacteria bacterium RBG_16_44_10]|uniref:50S ribosomal protein L7/L12 n=1 Tax=Candidatus Woykebacteria bacterium RBG_16_44_10 TaxID=1802597 RepID=A0A1G1WG16_9BACT|nr:MAG: hypothetical protein A2Z24_03050 [Candidatus Woykebacteria bacterium RBG_16_44_10]
MAQKIDLIRQALSAAESSLKLARQLLSELESEGLRNKPKARELPGITGIFDGQSMVTDKGDRYPVPENYASKSILVVGDTLKLVEQGREKRFKQIEHVKRHKTTGILAKKEGRWAAVTPEGSYRLLPASVEHYGAQVGTEVIVQLPANNLQSTWAAVEKINKKEGAKVEEKSPSSEGEKAVKEEQGDDSKNVASKVKKDSKPHEPKPKAESTQAEKKPETVTSEPPLTQPKKETQATPAVEVVEDELS